MGAVSYVSGCRDIQQMAQRTNNFLRQCLVLLVRGCVQEEGRGERNGVRREGNGTRDADEGGAAADYR